VALARDHLAYGEWLRRQGRRLDAREQLRSAHQMFTEFGMRGFAERARVELNATGVRVRTLATDTPAQLTAREAQIARLASDGLSNPKSPPAIHEPAHRRIPPAQIFAKLAISSRNQLHGALANSRRDAAATPWPRFPRDGNHHRADTYHARSPTTSSLAGARQRHAGCAPGTGLRRPEAMGGTLVPPELPLLR
jgi:hypothetical protein